MKREPKLIIVSAPSGSGKTTIVKHLLSAFPTLAFSVSATSRTMRTGEQHGKDYYFISVEEFKYKIESGDLLEWEEVYSGAFYGTLKSEVERMVSGGFDVIFDVDVVGGVNIKKVFGERALSVFVCPPSVEALKERLLCRNTDSETTIRKRLEKASYELTFRDKFDFILMNNNLEDAKKEAVLKVAEFLEISSEQICTEV